jgi:benzoyl-CoA reductase/2-hydroxyglutaryl-CoA dehydratase subunit BcrC/BadD/HgdB
MIPDREPARIGALDWERLMPSVPAEYEARCRFLRQAVPGGVPYLFSPHEYACRGDSLLSRLKYDNSLEALRLWAFLFSEKDRLFLAKRAGWKILAAMKDLGLVPALTYAFPKTLTFYADELWWAPCFAEEPHLLDEASKLGATEELCYVRAALGAMMTLDYFPEPDLCIAGVGGCCDDFSAVMQLIERHGRRVHWWEMVTRLDDRSCAPTEDYTKTSQGGTSFQQSALGFLEGQLQGVLGAVEEVTGHRVTEKELAASRGLFNGIRGQVRELRELVYNARKPPIPGLEMYLAEFIAIHACSEPEESVHVLDDLLALARRRLESGKSPLGQDPLRVFWVMPPTDASLVTLLEDLGGCVAGTEYMITHSFLPLATDRSPVRAVAENCMDDLMAGKPSFKAERIIADARRFGAEGVIFTGIFGASHCPHEEPLIAGMVERELGIPVLTFDVPFSPGRISEQVMNRMESFTDLMRTRRAPSVFVRAGRADAPQSAPGPFEYFRDSMAHEVDALRAMKKAGMGVVGIYCEYTPREVIMAAGAVPVCLCGASRRTIPAAETVLPSNLCPLIKSSFGYIISNRCPFYGLSDMIVAETTCDGKKKMYELLAEFRPQHILELTQKSDQEEAFRHWVSEVRKLRDFLSSFYRREITDEDLRKAVRAMNEERMLLREAFELGASDPPLATGVELGNLRYRVSGNPTNLRMLRAFVEAARGRASRGGCPVRKGAARVLLTGVPTAPETLKVVELVEECGGTVVVQEACSGWKPLDTLTSEEGDPIEAIARKHFSIPCSCLTPNPGRKELLTRLVEKFRPAAVIDLIWQACHTYNVESWSLEKHVRDKLGLPFLKLETDYSDSDRERLRVRIQTLLEMSQ